MYGWHHRALRPAEAAAAKPHTFLAGSDGDVGGSLRKLGPHLCDFLITCYTHAVDTGWRSLWLVPSLLCLKPALTILSLFWTLLFGVGLFFLLVQRPAQLSPLFFVLTSVAFSAACLNHTRPYTSSSLKYAPLKCCVQSSPQLVLRISCCTLVERKYPLFKPVRSSFFLCLKSAFLICLLLKNHFQRAVLKCVFVIIWESCAFFRP